MFKKLKHLLLAIICFGITSFGFAGIGDPSFKPQQGILGWCTHLARSVRNFTPPVVGIESNRTSTLLTLFEEGIRIASDDDKGLPRAYALYVTRGTDPIKVRQYGKHLIPLKRGDGLGILVRVKDEGEAKEIIEGLKACGLAIQAHKFHLASTIGGKLSPPSESIVARSLPYPEGPHLLEIALDYDPDSFSLKPPLEISSRIDNFSEASLTRLQEFVNVLHVAQYDIVIRYAGEIARFFDDASDIKLADRMIDTRFDFGTRGAPLNIYLSSQKSFTSASTKKDLTYEVKAGLEARHAILEILPAAVKLLIGYREEDRKLTLDHLDRFVQFSDLGSTRFEMNAKHEYLVGSYTIGGFTVQFSGSESFVSRNRRIADIIKRFRDLGFIDHLVVIGGKG